MTNLFPNLDGETSAVFGQPLDLCTGAEREHPAQRAEVMHLFRELRTPLYGYLVSSGVQPQEAEDVIQDTFLRLHEQLCQGTRIAEPRPWLFRVAHNLSVSFHRSARRLVHPEPADNANEAPLWPEQVDQRLNPEDLYLQKESLQRLETGLAQLTEQQSQCLHLRVEGLKYREIASIMGIGVSSVAELIQRAIVRLSGALHD